MTSYAVILLWIGSLLAAAEPALEFQRIGTQRELFIDGALVEQLDGAAQLRLHHPVPKEAAITHDAPWEGNASAYHSIFQDGAVFRMYYRGWGLKFDGQQLVTGPESLCYAASDDGIHWRKPELGLHDFQGSKANNIVISAEWAARHNVAVHAPAVFRDDNPQTPPEGRYKLFLISNDPLGMRPFQSPNGIHWSPVSDVPTITAGAFDSHNLAFWDAARGEYRAYWRIFTKGITTAQTWKPEGIRAIRTATSPDLIHWRNQADLNYGDSAEIQLYENGVTPYHRAPQIFLGFPVRYVDRGIVRHSTSAEDGSDRMTAERLRKWPESLKSLPQFEQRAQRAGLSERFGSALTEALLMSSRDGVNFHRWDEAFLRPGIERPGTWNYGHQLVAWRMVETKSELAGAPPELSIYTTEGYSTAEGTTLRRYALRLDGFVSVSAPLRGGELLTKPLVFEGSRLSLNFATSAAGRVRVEIQDSAGKPLPGFALDDCEELFGDTIDRYVVWHANRDVSSLAGKVVRLRFELQDADLYSYQFQN